MGCGCKKKQPAQTKAPSVVELNEKRNATQSQQETLVNDIIKKINKTINK